MPRAIASRSALAEPALGEPAHEHAERALAGHDDLVRAPDDVRIARDDDLAADVRQRALDRAQVAGAHVDDRDHAGQRTLGRRDRTAEARIDPRRRVARARERLEDALDRVVRVAAVVQHDVQVALRARRERREELLRELAVEVADPLALEALRRATRTPGRPQKSTATVTSTSSIGSVAEP